MPMGWALSRFRKDCGLRHPYRLPGATPPAAARPPGPDRERCDHDVAGFSIFVYAPLVRLARLGLQIAGPASNIRPKIIRH
mgnify:CR=1 FL=1